MIKKTLQETKYPNHYGEISQTSDHISAVLEDLSDLAMASDQYDNATKKAATDLYDRMEELAHRFDLFVKRFGDNWKK